MKSFSEPQFGNSRSRPFYANTHSLKRLLEQPPALLSPNTACSFSMCEFFHTIARVTGGRQRRHRHSRLDCEAFTAVVMVTLADRWSLRDCVSGAGVSKIERHCMCLSGEPVWDSVCRRGSERKKMLTYCEFADSRKPLFQRHSFVFCFNSSDAPFFRIWKHCSLCAASVSAVLSFVGSVQLLLHCHFFLIRAKDLQIAMGMLILTA